MGEGGLWKCLLRCSRSSVGKSPRDSWIDHPFFPLVAPVELSATLQLLSYSTTTYESRFLEMFGMFFAVDILCFCF